MPQSGRGTPILGRELKAVHASSLRLLLTPRVTKSSLARESRSKVSYNRHFVGPLFILPLFLSCLTFVTLFVAGYS